MKFQTREIDFCLIHVDNLGPEYSLGLLRVRNFFLSFQKDQIRYLIEHRDLVALVLIYESILRICGRRRLLISKRTADNALSDAQFCLSSLSEHVQFFLQRTWSIETDLLYSRARFSLFQISWSQWRYSNHICAIK